VSWIEKTEFFVKHELQNAEGGHDWWHIYRVWQNAKTIALTENVNVLVVELAALLHDIADSKFYDGDENIGPNKAQHFLTDIGVPTDVIEHVVNIIRHMSFKHTFGDVEFSSPEMLVLQDADRLDAIGAIGIARTFNYGGFKNRLIYHPDIKPQNYADIASYKNTTAPTINHFYEKLLLLKDSMNTKTGKQLAENRHAFMEQFLVQFYKEWEGVS
jgi:uncharacterized protein